MTPPGGRGLAALALAALLGVGGGAVTAFLAHQPEPAAGPDPLDIGVPLVNLVECTGETVVFVGEGDSAGDLRPSVADFDGVRYLEPAKSCDTAYPLDKEGNPTKYAAYIPPFATTKAACEQRMTNDHKGDLVTRLRDGNEDPVMCPCEMDRTTLPEIGEGVEPTTESGMWISMYQRMMAEAGLLDIEDVRMGVFDQETIDRTRFLQNNNFLNPYGYVDEDTWALIRDKACGEYDYS